MSVKIRVANRNEHELVGNGVADLIHELFPEFKDRYPRSKMIEAAKKLLRKDTGVRALIAFDASGATLGILTLNECAAISAGGSFGEIYELYVDPTARPQQVSLF